MLPLLKIFKDRLSPFIKALNLTDSLATRHNQILNASVKVRGIFRAHSQAIFLNITTKNLAECH
jgi:hypothetical protein